MMFKIYPMSLGFMNFWHMFIRAWRNEVTKRSPGKNLYDQENIQISKRVEPPPKSEKDKEEVTVEAKSA